MKKKYSRILGVGLALMLLASLFGFAAPVSADTVEWSAIGNPSVFTLNMADVEVGPIAVSPDGGTVFAAVQTDVAIFVPALSLVAGNWALVSSTDGGHNWVATGLVNNGGPIRGIAVSSNFATDSTLYVAALSPTTAREAVFRSNDGGVTFIELKQIFDSGGAPITNIWAIDMYPATPYPYVMVGTDLDVLVLKDAVFEIWRDQELGVDARAVAFAPDFATTNFIWAVTVLGVVSATNSPGAWGTILTNTPALVAPVSASMAFPGDYSSATAPNLFVGIDSGGANTGGVWWVRGLPFPVPSLISKQYGALPVPATQWDVRSIAVSGPMASATILAGLQDAAAIVGSLTGGITWQLPVFKQPTGVNATYVMMAPDFATSNVAYVGTSDGLALGTAEPGVTAAAFQVSRDGGMSWDQVGLIDTVFAVINDIAVVSLDTIFMVTDGFSLWKTTDATATAPIWERILTTGTATIPANNLAAGATLRLVATSPAFATDGAVFTTDNATGIMKSIDGGGIFAAMGAPALAITALHVRDATFAFTGAATQLYRTDDGGYSWLPATTPPGTPVASIASSPAGAMPPGQLMVGDTTGGVFLSMDSGAAFFPLGFGVTGGPANVAFDANYATNFLVYAGGSGPPPLNSTIMRMDVTQPALGWTSIGDVPTAAAVVASDSFQIDDNVADTGTITVTAGSVILAPQGGASVAGTVLSPNTMTITPAMGPVAWTSPAGAALDTILVTAATANSAGTVTPVAGTTISIVTDADGDVGLVQPAPGVAGNWYLPDLAGVGAAAPSVINGLVMSPDGTLYGSNALTGQAVERSLNPTASATAPAEAAFAPVWERMNTALPTTATLMGLWLVVDDTLAVTGSKNVFFSIDTAPPTFPFPLTGPMQIMTYTDTLAAPVVLTEPESGTIYPRITEVKLKWETLTGALFYNWMVAEDAWFLYMADSGLSMYPFVTSRLLSAGQTYFWTVRVDSPLLSRLAEDWSFTTELGGRVWHPFQPIGGVAPGPGASDVMVKPTFQWNGADWATSYEFMLADNAAFTGATTKTLTTTSWVSDTDLGYSTTWYWKVRALSGTSESEWSDVGVFTTMAEPVEPEPAVVVVTEPAEPAPAPEIVEIPVSPPVPNWALYTIIIIGAVLVVFVIVLIMRTRRPI